MCELVNHQPGCEWNLLDWRTEGGRGWGSEPGSTQKSEKVLAMGGGEKYREG